MGQPTIARLIERYMRHARDYYRKPKSRRPTGEADNMYDALRSVMAIAAREEDEQRVNWLEPTGGAANGERRGYRVLSSLTPDEFRPSDLRLVRQHMIDAGLARRTVNARINRVRRFFRWCVEYEYCEIDVLQRLQTVSALPRGRSKAKELPGVRPVEWERVEKTLFVVPRLLAVAIQVQWHTGMRPGELVQMRACDVDRSGGEPWVYRPPEHKTEHLSPGNGDDGDCDREVPIGPKCRILLEPVLTRLTEQGVLPFMDPPRIFPWTVNSYRQAIVRACRRHKIPSWTPLQVRHSYATRLRAAEDIEASRVMLGHTDAATTQIYAEIDKRKRRELAERFG